MHAGLLRPDSAPAPALAEAAQTAAELAAMPRAGTAPGQVALVFDYASAWAWATQPQGRDFDYFRLTFAWYRALRRLGLDIDIIAPDTADLSPWKLVLAPGLAVLPDTLKGAIAAQQATVILGPRSNAKTAEMAIPVPLPPNLPGLEALVARVESLPPAAAIPLTQGGTIRHWFEEVETSEAVSETTSDGRPVLVGAGKVQYLAGWPDDATLHRLLARACTDLGLPVEDLPDSLRLRRTGTHRLVFNHGPEPITWHGQTLPPAGVAFLPL
jgi:beta-galactosidase